MRIVMGVSQYEEGHRLVKDLERLRFRQPSVDVVNVLEAPGGAIGKFLLTASEGEYYSQYLRHEEFKSRTMLSALADELQTRSFPCETHILEGHASDEIMQHSEKQKADLIMLHMTQKTYSDGFMTGRVPRKLLLTSPLSLFFHKEEPRHFPLSRVVWATDHSAYSMECLQKFMDFAPEGVEQITVLTVFPSELVPIISPLLGHIQVDVQQWARNKYKEENEKVVAAFISAGYQSTSELRDGPVSAAIATSMEHNRAGLLVLGSQGHGFLERMTVGSVSFHETIYGPYSTMVIRT